MRQPDDEMREAPHETLQANRRLARPHPNDHGRHHEPAEEGFVASLARAPAAPQAGDASETRRSLERASAHREREDAGEGLW